MRYLTKSRYKLLPPVFENWSNDQLDELLSDVEDLNNGGAAHTASCNTPTCPNKNEIKSPKHSCATVN